MTARTERTLWWVTLIGLVAAVVVMLAAWN